MPGARSATGGGRRRRGFARSWVGEASRFECRRRQAAYSLCSEQAVNSGRHSAPRFFSTLVRYSCQTTLVLLLVLDDRALQPGGQVVRPSPRRCRSCRPAPCRWPAPRSPRRWRARRTGVLSLFLPSSVWPGAQLAEDGDDLLDRLVGGHLRPSAPGWRPVRVTRLRTMSISVSSVVGVGSTTMLKRRLRAADMSLTPRSRVLAVAMIEKPFAGRRPRSPAPAPTSASPTAARSARPAPRRRSG